MGSTTTQTSKMPQWQEDFIRENILPLGVEIGNKEYTPYEGDMIAGFSDMQNQALSGFGGLDTSGQAFQDASSVQRGLTSFDPNAAAAAQLGDAAGMSSSQIADTERYGTERFRAAQMGDTERFGAAQLGDAERFSAAQLGMARGIDGTGAVSAAQAPGQIDVNQLASTDFSQYMSPYTQNVINRSLQTLGGAQEQALNQMGAQATAANAFGGSRQGVAEAATREAYGKQAADLISGLNEKAYSQALQAGQFDIGNVQSARGLQSGQQMTAETLGQQAREAGAQRDQAARAGNMAAANQFASQQAQLEQASRSANVGASNQFATQQAQLEQAARAANAGVANQFMSQQAGYEQQAAASNAAAANQAAAAQAAAANQRAAQQASADQAAAAANQAAQNQFALQQAGYNQAAGMADYQGQFNTAGIQSGAANAMAGLSNDQLQSQLAGLGAQMTAGGTQQALDQAQLQADYAAFQQEQQDPLTRLSSLLQAGSGVPAGLGTVSTRDPFGGLKAFGSVMQGAGALGTGFGYGSKPGYGG